MDDPPPYSTTPKSTPTDETHSPRQYPDAHHLAARATLLDVCTVAALATRHGPVYSHTNQCTEALGQVMEAGAQTLMQENVMREDSPAFAPGLSQSFHTMPSHVEPPRSQAVESRPSYGWPFGQHGFASNWELQHGLHNPAGVIEPDEPGHLASQIDEGYGEGDDDYSWMDWPTLAEAEPYVGCRMSGLLHFRSSVDAALQCSTLVYKPARMRRRKHRAAMHQGPTSFRHQHRYQSLKHAAQV